MALLRIEISRFRIDKNVNYMTNVINDFLTLCKVKERKLLILRGVSTK